MTIGPPRPGATLVRIPASHLAYLVSRQTRLPHPLPARLVVPPLGAEEAPWCQCEEPDWRTCGPIFGAVRECARCGSPDREELGRWPGST